MEFKVTLEDRSESFLEQLAQIAYNANKDDVMIFVSSEDCTQCGLSKDDLIYFFKTNTLEGIHNGAIVLTFDYEVWIFSRDSKGVMLKALDEDNTVTIKNEELEKWMSEGGVIAAARVIVKSC